MGPAHHLLHLAATESSMSSTRCHHASASSCGCQQDMAPTHTHPFKHKKGTTRLQTSPHRQWNIQPLPSLRWLGEGENCGVDTRAKAPWLLFCAPAGCTRQGCRCGLQESCRFERQRARHSASFHLDSSRPVDSPDSSAVHRELRSCSSGTCSAELPWG